MFKSRLLSILIFIFFSSIYFSNAQILFDGPADGLSDSGKVVSTDNFGPTAPAVGNQRFKIFNIKEDVKDLPDPGYLRPAKAPLGSNFIEDPAFKLSKQGSINGNQIVFESFQGIPDEAVGGFFRIPPDPYIASGPEELLYVVNSRFRITDKQGNILKTIPADAWFSNLGINGVSPFDPKIIYDQLSKRWVMVWLHVDDANSQAFFLISVSDDSTALGSWYNYALASNLNGTTPTGTWADYEGVGFDADFIYITSNQFPFSGNNPPTARIRIVSKFDLYSNTGDPVQWRDLFNVKYPDGTTSAFGIRPARMYSTPSNGEYYFITHSRLTTKNDVGFYKLTDQFGSVSLTGTLIPVTQYTNPPNADQLGGSTILIEGGGGANFRNEPLFKDGVLHAVHGVGSGSSNQYSAFRYLAIDVATETLDEDFAFGKDEFWYFYPALAVDQNDNVVITYSRSGLTQYAGAFFSTFDPGTSILSGSIVIQPGKGNYVKDFGSGRNRWGDYMGAWVDPADPNNIWLFTEYAAAKNVWGTWVAGVRMVPFNGLRLVVNKPDVDFGNTEVGFNSNIISVTLRSEGTDNIQINNITSSAGPFKVLNTLNFPINLSSFDTLALDLQFSPTDTGTFNNVITVTSNDPNFSGINVTGKGFVINPVTKGVIYASSGVSNSGKIFTIDPASGSATLLGSSLFNEITDISINPKNGVMYGIHPLETETELLRVNASKGDSYNLVNIPLADISAIAFDTLGTLYAAKEDGALYTIDILTGAATFLDSAKVPIGGMQFNPTTNELWVTAPFLFGKPKDKIYKVDVATGDTVFMGSTKINNLHNDIVFDEQGNIFIVAGINTRTNDLLSIDPATMAGTKIGSTGQRHLTGLARLSTFVTSVESNLKNNELPNSFVLNQNYPNPFNPSTTIEYSLPSEANVKIVIYNILGEEVNTLVNQNQKPGNYRVVWNARNIAGKQVSSGIYFYSMKANGLNGADFVQVRKMILLR